MQVKEDIIRLKQLNRAFRQTAKTLGMAKRFGTFLKRRNEKTQ